MRHACPLACLAVSLIGCAAGTDFEDPQHVSTWANTASALAVYAVVYEPIAFADGEHSYPDPTCPATSDDGTAVTIAGDCTTVGGVRWVGRATVTREPDGSRALRLEAFGRDDSGGDPPTDTGTATVSAPEAGSQSFEVQVTRDGLTSLAFRYSGRVEGGYSGPTVWSGSGAVTRGGFADPSGTVQAVTEAQRRDETVCEFENLSGTTTLTTDGQTLVVTYDGATDCDEDQAATYQLDGEDRGPVTGVACAASPAPGRGGLSLAALALAGLALRLRRRS